jgi:acyl dehydratase
MTIDLSVAQKTIGPRMTTYNWRDTALYAIGLGAGVNDLGYLLDNPPPKVAPTFGVIPAFGPVFELLEETGGNLVTLLHSAQRTELLRPFPPEGEMATTATVKGIWDMKIGALVAVETLTTVDGRETAKTEWQLLMRGEGGFGGPRPPRLLRTSRPPAGFSPLFSVEVPTSIDQALLYRLNGDVNPIHSHPEVAREAGFDRPILHGLCFYGIAARVALKALAGDDPARFKSFAARFAKVVMPGDTLVVEGFALDTPGRVALTVTVKETGDQAIANAEMVYLP